MLAYIKIKLNNDKIGYLYDCNYSCIEFVKRLRNCHLIKRKSEFNRYIDILSNNLLNKPLILKGFEVKGIGI